MSTTTTITATTITTALEVGEWAPAPPNSKRSPCPVLNALANHGYLPRDGRNIHADQLFAALQHIGVGPDLQNKLVPVVFKVHSQKDIQGVREPYDVDENGEPVLDLEQLGIANSTEHNVSLTRQDRQLGDPFKLQPNQMKEFVQSSTDGSHISVTDMGRFRKARFDQQKLANPQLSFNSFNHFLACSEAAMIHCLFGQGLWYRTPISYIKALFEEERLPIEEGWQPRLTPLFNAEMLVILKQISSICWPLGPKTTFKEWLLM